MIRLEETVPYFPSDIVLRRQRQHVMMDATRPGAVTSGTYVFGAIWRTFVLPDGNLRATQAFGRIRECIVGSDGATTWRRVAALPFWSVAVCCVEKFRLLAMQCFPDDCGAPFWWGLEHAP